MQSTLKNNKEMHFELHYNKVSIDINHKLFKNHKNVENFVKLSWGLWGFSVP